MIKKKKESLLTISHEARNVHRQAIVIDLHVDTLFLVFKLRYNLSRRHKNRIPGSPFVWHVDAARLREGGVSALWFTLPVFPLKIARRGGKVQRMLKRVNEWASRMSEDLWLSQTAEDILKARERGVPAFFLTLEGAHGIKARDVSSLKRQGLTSITLAHLLPCDAAYPSTLKRWVERPLPSEGFKLIEAMEDCNLIVDLAHMGRRSFIDAIGKCSKPPVVSHTGCYGLKPVWRNISDYEAKRVADKGGVIGVIFAPCFLSSSLFASIDCVVEHICYLVKLLGDDFVGLGSDFDGWVPSMPTMLEDVSKLPLLTDRLLKRGVPADSIKKILGGNALRIIREVC